MKKAYEKAIKVGVTVWAVPTCVILLLFILTALGTTDITVTTSIRDSLLFSVFFLAPLGISSALMVAYSHLAKKPKILFATPILSITLTICLIMFADALVHLSSGEREMLAVVTLFIGIPLIHLALGTGIATFLYLRYVRQAQSHLRKETTR